MNATDTNPRELHNFREGDTVRRYYATSGNVSKTTYVVVAVDAQGTWIKEIGPHMLGGCKPYRATQLRMVTTAPAAPAEEAPAPATTERPARLDTANRAACLREAATTARSRANGAFTQREIEKSIAAAATYEKEAERIEAHLATQAEVAAQAQLLHAVRATETTGTAHRKTIEAMGRANPGTAESRAAFAAEYDARADLFRARETMEAACAAYCLTAGLIRVPALMLQPGDVVCSAELVNYSTHTVYSTRTDIENMFWVQFSTHESKYSETRNPVFYVLRK